MFWRVRLKKTVIAIEISTLESVQMQKFVQNKKTSKYGTKNTFIWVF